MSMTRRRAMAMGAAGCAATIPTTATAAVRRRIKDSPMAIQVLNEVHPRWHEAIRAGEYRQTLHEEIQWCIEKGRAAGMPVVIGPGVWPIEEPLSIRDDAAGFAVGDQLLGMGSARTTLWLMRPDMPGIEAQSVRQLTLRGLAIEGCNLFRLSAPSPDPDLYRGPGVSDDHVGIRLDPDIGAPSGSSGVMLDDVEARSCLIGVQIRRDTENIQGDAVTSRDCRWFDCQVGIAIGTTQARNLVVERNRVYGCWTAYDALSYGGPGVPPLLITGGDINAWQVIRASAGYGVCTMSSVYTEGTARIGQWGTGHSAGRFPLLMQGCEFALGGPDWDAEPVLLEGGGPVHMVGGGLYPNWSRAAHATLDFGSSSGGAPLTIEGAALYVAEGGRVVRQETTPVVRGCWRVQRGAGGAPVWGGPYDGE
jgi:hypothetical protein